MSTAEMAHRARDFGLQCLWRHRRGAGRKADLATPRSSTRLAVPAEADLAIDAAASQALLAAADLLVDGEWPIFGVAMRRFGKEIDWFRDPLTGIRAFERHYCFRIPYRDEDRIGNVKFIWETSRHQHLTVLAAAYRLSRNPRYAERVADHLISWWAANPFLTGVHWASGIELGIRLISWTWIRRMLDGWPGVNSLFEHNEDFIVQLSHHQEFLSTFWSHGSSANNHLIAEAVGLFVASLAFPFLNRSSEWRREASGILEREIVRQVDNEGLNRELASDYQAFVLELLLVAAIEGDAANAPLSDAFWHRVQCMMDAFAATLDSTGRPPRQGDSDDGTALLLDAPQYNRWMSLLSTGARLFEPLPWWGKIAHGDVRTAFLTSLARKRAVSGSRPARCTAYFAEGGLIFLRDSEPDQPEIWCRCDHGPHGFLSIAAHAHADALAIELRHGGVDILADPGTYCYHGDPRYRRYFRSTLGHNTLELGGIDQAVSGGPFAWLTQPAARLHHASGLYGGPEARWTASHDGYARRLRAVHYRSVTLERRPRRVVVEDWVETPRPQQGRLAFHLGPTVRCTRDGRTVSLNWMVDGVEFAARLLLPPEMKWSVHRGDELAGWYSPGFARKRPSATLIGTGCLSRATRLVTELLFCDGGPRRLDKTGGQMALLTTALHRVAPGD